MTVTLTHHGAPLAPQQRGLWFLQQLRPGTAEYNLQIGLRLRGPLQIGRLAEALGLIAARHEPLRTRIVAGADGVPRQHVSPPTAFDLPVAPRDEYEAGTDDDTIRTALQAELGTPFDLVTELPMRVLLVRLGPDDHLLALTFNHLAMDGVSLTIVAAELAAAYEALVAGRPVELPPLPTSYTEYAAAAAADETRTDGLDFWRRELDGVGQLELPADRHGHGVGARMITLRREVDAATVSALRAVAREARTSLYAVGLTAYGLMLARTTGQRDFAVGMPVAGRTDTDVQPLVGCFLNTVCVRFRIDDGLTFVEQARRTADALARTLEHQQVPFGDVVRAVRAERTTSRHPLFSAFCSVLDDAPPAFELAGLRTEAVVADHPVARFDLNVTFALGLEPAALQLEFSDALFEPDSAQRFAERMVRVLDWVAADPTRRVGSVPLVGRAERNEVLDLLNGRTDG